MNKGEEPATARALHANGYYLLYNTDCPVDSVIIIIIVLFSCIPLLKTAAGAQHFHLSEKLNTRYSAIAFQRACPYRDNFDDA